MIYHLDTNVCIALINRSSPLVRARFEASITAGDPIYVSSVVAYELWYGVAKSVRRSINAQRLTVFFSGPLEIVPLDVDDARKAGEVRALLEQAGTPIGAYDLLIAGQALNHGATLVTANTAEFARVAGLLWEDWARART